MSRNTFDRGEFMRFIDGFLAVHPDVVKDQQHGWSIYWQPKKVDSKELDAAHPGWHVVG